MRQIVCSAYGYDAALGGRVSPDPLGHAASMSLYDYAAGDPVNRLDPDGRCAKGAVQGLQFGALPDNASLSYQIGYGIGAVGSAISLLSGGDSNNTNSAISLTTPDLRPSGYSDGFGDHYSFCYSCHDPNDPGARLQFQMAQNVTVGIRAYTQVAFIAATAGLGEFSALEETAANTTARTFTSSDRKRHV